ncbi:MAG: CoA protein activase [Dethiobacteria bacterium]|jgi:predicted nucleotide-binding protein (sugar kinase/HSP70/actin superfamily)|nr:CoA protein activase [Bacillota bacterium]
MKVSFAHMGTSPIAFEMLLQDLGHEVIYPPKPSERTLSLGVQYAPEFACIPFKIVLGTYVELLMAGAETLVSAGGYGPCRAGFYGEMHRRILQDVGYDFELIFFFPPLKKPADFYRKLLKLKGKNSWRTLIYAVRKAWLMLQTLDDLEIRSHQVRARELKRRDTTAAFRKGLTYLREARSFSEIKEARAAALEELEKVERDDTREPLKVGIIGEIYVQLEPFANFHIEELLGELGVETRRSIFLTNFTRHDILSAAGDKTAIKLAQSYLGQKIGGHGQNSVGDIIRFSQSGYDGVVQLAPFTCIPEIVAKSIIPYLSKKFDIPVFTFFIDEQTGQAGVETRLEAFVDLMHQRRARKREMIQQAG